MTFFSNAWWVSTAIGALLLSVIGAYVKAGIDRGAGFVFVKWTRRSVRARRLFARRVIELSRDPALRERSFQTELRLRHVTVEYLLLGLILLGVASIANLAEISKRLFDAHGVPPSGAALLIKFVTVTSLSGALISIIASLWSHATAGAIVKILDASDDLRARRDQRLSKRLRSTAAPSKSAQVP